MSWTPNLTYIPKLDEILDARDDRKANLTCGVEMEFLVPATCTRAPVCGLRFEVGEGEIEDCKKQVRTQLLAMLENELPELIFSDMDEDDFHPPHDNVVIYHCWRLGSDSTVCKIDGPGSRERAHLWTECELTSTVMDDDDYARNVEDICRVLRQARAYMNNSTALHVHVGRGDEPFSLLTLKKFASLYWLMEKPILDVHHPSRRNNKYCFRLNKCSVLATTSSARLEVEIRDSKSKDLEQFHRYIPDTDFGRLRMIQLRRIWACDSIEEVATLMQRGDKTPLARAADLRGAVGFKRFLPAGKTGGNLQTFEWRQMSGSLDANHINRWIEFCLAFTNFCRLSDSSTFRDLVETLVEGGDDYVVSDLFEALDVDPRIFEDMLSVWSEDPDCQQ
ncbi:putative amidoligase enzyme-domain-containing protein [Astrocystis sublimbata]|nr:putative amidoligase enzyme-domain-containing protein [Astrocystis sublimbata]